MKKEIIDLESVYYPEYQMANLEDQENIIIKDIKSIFTSFFGTFTILIIGIIIALIFPICMLTMTGYLAYALNIVLYLSFDEIAYLSALHIFAIIGYGRIIVLFTRWINKRFIEGAK